MTIQHKQSLFFENIKTMNSEQINKILKKDIYVQPLFHGVFPSDELPSPQIGCYVLNTDPSYRQGEHWVAVYCDRHYVEYFDSYGQAPEQFLNFLSKFKKPIIYNSQQLQGISTVCGQYVIYYLHHRCRGLSMFHITQVFSKQLHHNDMLVNYWINKHFNVYEPIFDLNLL